MALYDITLGIEKQNKLDIFNLFGSSHVPDEKEQGRVIADYLSKWGGELISKKVENGKLIIRISK